MTLRDLGHRAYEGVRLPPTHNTWVLLRHAVARAWASWFVKVALVFAWVPPAVSLVILFVKAGLEKAMRDAAPEGAAMTAKFLEVPGTVRGLFGWQFWLFVTLISLGAGATAVARDLEFKAFRFYFSKPVEPWQYLTARVLAVGVWCLGVTWIPSVLLTVGAAGILGEPAHLGVLLPATLYATVMAGVMSVLSVAVSSASPSRGLTMSLWVVLLLVPQVVGAIVARTLDFPWALLASLPTLLGVVGDALFKLAPHPVLRWYHAAPVLGFACLLGLTFAYRRIQRAEVIA